MAEDSLKKTQCPGYEKYDLFPNATYLQSQITRDRRKSK